MFVHLVKWIHLLCTLGLLGGTLFCFIRSTKTKQLAPRMTHKIIIYVGTLALITGTLLVYPKHFTFHTPWIQAAYLMVGGYITTIGLLNRYRNALLFKYSTLINLTYFLLIIVLIFVAHDAVTKSTFEIFY